MSPVGAFPAVPAPAVLLLDERTIAVDSWTVEGVRLLPGTIIAAPGALISASIQVGGKIRLEIDVVLRYDGTTEGKDVFFFVDLDPEHAALIHRLEDDAALERSDRLLAALEDGGAAAAAGSALRRVRTAVAFGFAALLLAGVLWLLYTTLATVQSRYGAVSAPAVRIDSPATGRLALEVAVGQRVAPQQLLGRVDGTETLSRIDAIDQEILSLRSRSLGITARLQDLAAFEATAPTQDAMLEAARKARDLLDARADLYDNDAERLTRLADGGVGPRARAEEAQARAMEARARAELQAQEVARLEAEAQLRAAGVYAPYPRDSLVGTATLDAERIGIERTIKALMDEKARLVHQGFLASPCGCVVHAIAGTDGNTIGTGNHVMTLVDADRPLLQALVLAEEAQTLRVGDRAVVNLADGRGGTAYITAISYTPIDPHRAGLPHDIFSVDRYARLDLSMEGLDNAPIGMVADVRIVGRGVADALGLDLLRDLVANPQGVFEGLW